VKFSGFSWDDMTAEISNLSASSTMGELLAAFPGAQRALFRKYHIGGCSSCGFQPEETIAQICARNGDLNAGELLAFVREAQNEDNKILIDAPELDRLRREGVVARLLDIRPREEIEAVKIEGAIAFTQEIMTEMLGKWPRGEMVVIYDHLGSKSMDAAAYFLGHGFTKVRALRGGIDAWSQEVDATVGRYRVE
jgi:rhodanese-related sulfurtransferase